MEQNINAEVNLYPNSTDAPARRQDHDGSFLEREVVSSVTECTGIAPALDPDDPLAQVTEAELYGVHAPKEPLMPRPE